MALARSGSRPFSKKFCASISQNPCFEPRSVRSRPSKQAKRNSIFCAALRLEELALARACAAGNERAWQDFISRYRQKLHSMALHITRDAAHAAELADSLFADLYGVNVRDGVRNSKLALLHRPWFARRLAAHGDGAGVHQPLSQAKTHGESRRTDRRRRAVCGASRLRPARHLRSATGDGDRRGAGGALVRGQVHPGILLSGWPNPGRDCAHAGTARIERQPAA